MTEVSVIIPAHNAAMTLGRTLRSLLEDRSVIGEVLIINDGSTDNTLIQAEHYADQFELNLIVHSVSCFSAGAARNHGIEKANFPYLYFIDADDCLMPGGLIRLLAQLQKRPESGLAIGGSIRETAGRAPLRRIPTGYGSNPVSNAELYLRNGSPPIAIGSGLVRASKMKDVRFPSDMVLDEDTWFWSAIMARAQLETLEEPIVTYNLDEHRTALRFLTTPLRDWTLIARRFRKLSALGVSKETLSYRNAWLAQRFARQLMKQRRFKEGSSLLRPVLAHPTLSRELRTIKYNLYCRLGIILDQSKPAHLTSGLKTRNGRTVIVSHDAAYPAVSGADIRNLKNARFASRSGKVALVSIGEVPNPTKLKNIDLISLSKKSDQKAASIYSRRTKNEPRISRIALERLLHRLDEFEPETVIVEGIYLNALVPHIKAKSNATVITDMHNVETDLALKVHGSKNVDLAARVQSWKLRRLERKAIKNSDHIWVCTEEDRTRLIERYCKSINISVVPNGVPPRDYPKPKILADHGGNPNLLFVGHLGYQPNVDAALRLAKSIMPSVLTCFPGATLDLVGRYPRRAILELDKLPYVRVTANPQDLEPYLRRADIAVVPLSAGGGSRIKIIEAAICGIPIVASKVAAEGLVFLDDFELLIADTDSEIIEACNQLLKSMTNQKRIRDAAYQTSKNLYQDENLQSYFDKALGRSSQTAGSVDVVDSGK